MFQTLKLMNIVLIIVYLYTVVVVFITVRLRVVKKYLSNLIDVIGFNQSIRPLIGAIVASAPGGWGGLGLPPEYPSLPPLQDRGTAAQRSAAWRAAARLCRGAASSLQHGAVRCAVLPAV